MFVTFAFGSTLSQVLMTPTITMAHPSVTATEVRAWVCTLVLYDEIAYASHGMNLTLSSLNDSCFLTF